MLLCFLLIFFFFFQLLFDILNFFRHFSNQQVINYAFNLCVYVCVFFFFFKQKLFHQFKYNYFLFSEKKKIMDPPSDQNVATQQQQQQSILQPTALASSLNSINAPVALLKPQSTELIKTKFSAMDCCSWSLVLGTTIGTLYLFDPESLRRFGLISNKDLRDPIVRLKWAPSANQSNTSGLIAIATSKQTIILMEINLQSKKEKERIASRIQTPTNSPVSYWVWDDNSANLYFGDESGGVYHLSVDAARRSKNYQPELLFRCDSNVVQLVLANEKLLASSLTRCLLFDLRSRRSVLSQSTGTTNSTSSSSQNVLLTASTLANPNQAPSIPAGTPMQIGSQLRDGRFVFFF